MSLLRPYTASPDQPLPPMPVLLDGEVEYEIERVLDHRDVKVSQLSKRKKREFLVKWANYGHESHSWVPAADAQNCQDLIQEYYLSKRKVGKV